MSTDSRHAPHTGRSRKKLLQRLYRSTEAEDFSQLRQIINEITQANPHTRHDILIKGWQIKLPRSKSSLTQQAASTSTTSNTSSPMQRPTPVHPVADSRPVSHFPPESWPVNYDHLMSMYPFSSPNMTHTLRLIEQFDICQCAWLCFNDSEVKIVEMHNRSSRTFKLSAKIEHIQIDVVDELDAGRKAFVFCHQYTHDPILSTPVEIYLLNICSFCELSLYYDSATLICSSRSRCNDISLTGDRKKTDENYVAGCG
ncbi:uncharacterized protein BJ212DRAFT_1300335 [Suillus subaureus]|uniref:Uncharacterized protein n=1 Tax=Suillus subaureus TaxID=48587 RepID=A0A9P7E9D5_9AGAM|nr:uncharacterized protein BJ212DRAFT_1300335 [Suillus subaureus]KAG1815167.1 hypothetical protein BJ212DRAFT_1300335 [Suillus subaureus]